MGDREDAYREMYKNSLQLGEYTPSGKLRMKTDSMNSWHEYFKDMLQWRRMFSIANSFIKLIGYTIIPIDLFLGIILLIISETIELIRKLV